MHVDKMEPVHDIYAKVSASLVPRSHPQKEEKGSGDFGQFSWFGRLWAHVPTRVHLNKARIWLASKAA